MNNNRYETMALTYAEKIDINRKIELDSYREELIQVLEDSKKLVLDCNNLVQMRALKTRIDKISNPRKTDKSDEFREYKRKKYHENKERYNEQLRMKRQKIREIIS